MYIKTLRVVTAFRLPPSQGEDARVDDCNAGDYETDKSGVGHPVTMVIAAVLSR